VTVKLSSAPRHRQFVIDALRQLRLGLLQQVAIQPLQQRFAGFQDFPKAAAVGVPNLVTQLTQACFQQLADEANFLRRQLKLAHALSLPAEGVIVHV
jgi:hypothetical protein